MDIDINSKNNDYFNSDNSTNNKIINVNYNLPEIGKDSSINIFSRNKKFIYALNQPLLKRKNNLSSGELTLCEGRLLNDLAELKRSKIIGKICNIKLYDYIKIDNNGFELIIEFVNFFSVKFIFDQNYPCSPPKIFYNKGLKPKNIFDNDGNALIESIKKNNWTPCIWLSTLVYSIQLLISSEINSYNYSLSNCNNENNSQGLNNYFMKSKMQKYGKRKWDSYINECRNYYNKECAILPELEKNLKQLKIK